MLLSGNLYLFFYKRVKASKKCIVQAIYMHLTSGGSLQLGQTGINCYTITSATLARV